MRIRRGVRDRFDRAPDARARARMTSSTAVQPQAMTPRQHTVLPHYLAAIYGLAIVYASLQPFGPWIAPPAGTPFFLFSNAPARFTRFDVLANAITYVPFGFLL